MGWEEHVVLVEGNSVRRRLADVCINDSGVSRVLVHPVIKSYLRSANVHFVQYRCRTMPAGRCFYLYGERKNR